jgi:C4-dicarboxylate transporter DctM subunit
VASAGILSNLIPPSLAAIFFGVLTEVSIGKLFIAGIIPGIILTIFYCITIWVLVKRKPSIAPSAIEHFTLTEKITSLIGLLPMLFIFACVIGGIYSGTFSPAEAAGIGACLSLVVVFAMRRLTWQRFLNSMKGTMKITAFIMMIITGALLFAHTIAVTEFPNVLNSMIIGLQAPPIVVLFVIIVVTTLLGCVLDFFGTMVLTVPFLFPLVTQGLGYDPVWYGNFTVILLEIALLTPPVAANIYITQGVDGEASSMDVIRGVMPFYIAAFTLLLLLVFFPQISMWLPSLM